MTRGAWSDTTLRRLALVSFFFVLAVAVVNPALGNGIVNDLKGKANGNHLVDYGDSVYCFLMAVSALLILWFRPRHSVGWILMLVGGLEAVCTFGQTYGVRAIVRPEEGLPLGTLLLSWSAPLWIPSALLLVTCMLLRYPTGRIDGRWARRVDRAVIVGFALMWIGYAGGDASVTDEVPSQLPPVRLPEVLSVALMLPAGVAIVGGMVFTLLHTARRTWKASYPERQQLAWLITVAPVAVVMLFTDYEGLQRFFYLIPLAVVVGVLRYRMLGIEVVIRRTLLYGLLTGLVLLVFVAVTAGLSSVLPSGGLPTFLAAGLVAVGVVPLRDRLQRGVDRLVYGDRGDPLAALRRLGSPLGLSPDAALLPEVLGGIASSLRLPGAQIVGAAGARASVGLLGDDPVDVPLVMAGQQVGVLSLARRPGETRLPAPDQRLVEALVPLVAAVLHAVELTEALRIEKERVLAATGTERARLRQDLHDGLGPSLTGIGLGLEALESRVGASDLVARLRAETASSLEEVRRIIDGLRPGALESADLLALLRLRAEHLSSTTALRVEVVAPDRLPVLPDAVEAAALRVVEEALTNVVRHAGATRCTVTVALDDELRVEVRDDGRGYDGPRPGGVGIGSMQARAEALGGSCRVSGGATGTTVSLAIPLVPQAVTEVAS